MRTCAAIPGAGGEQTLCGFAFDVTDTEEDVEKFDMAGPGELVTCDRCRAVIAEIKAIKQWRMPNGEGK